ncbi:MAG: hypothetical protein K2P39_08570 [Lachnospiraceae bacterium]|nr:hypothetical protein [Lachnospiraceae bacterium]
MRTRTVNDRVLYALAALTGTVAFVLIYGVNVLNPVYDDWLLGQGDLSQHYLGWCFFRRGSWAFPIGLTDNLAYPSYTSVIFTDSIPLLAVFFKLLSPVLPETFQYFGWWGIVSFALQGYFAARILREFSVARLQTLIGSIFFVVSPIVIERMFRHTALGGHWLILASVYLFVRHKKEYQKVGRTVLWWGIIGALTASVHLYYLPMCGAFLCGYVLCSFLRDAKVRLRHLLVGISFAAALFASTYLLGGFSTRASSDGDGLGECSFNLNGFFNEKGYSRFLDALPMYHESQYEGFAYLGIGIFILMAAAAAFLVLDLVKNRGRSIRKYSIGIVSGLLISVGLILFAASPSVTWNDKLLFVLTDSSTLTHYWSIFRSSGRIVWPVCYLIYLVVIVCNGKLWERCLKNERAAAVVPALLLASCCFLQLYDIGGKLAEQRERFGMKQTYVPVLEDALWDELARQEGLEHFVWVSNSFENRQILEMARWAYDNELTMNIFYFARGISVIEDTQYSLQNPDDTYVFVFKPEEMTAYPDCGLNFYAADGYIVGTTFALDRERVTFDEF